MDPWNMNDPDHETEDGNGTLEEVVTVDIDDYASLAEIASREGVQVERLEERNLVDPVSITVILFGTSFAVATVLYVLENAKGGQVFDLRPEAQKSAYRSKDIGYGYVQIIAVDGSVRVEVKEPRGMFGHVLDTIASLVRQGGAPATAAPLQEAVQDALGDVASVRVEIVS